MTLTRFVPFLTWARETSPSTLRADLLAGITGSVLSLPQGVAFATIAGMPPEYGLYAAMFPTIIAALFGSSRLMVCGPTTPGSIVLFSTLSQFAVPGSSEYVRLALTLAFMVGVTQLVLGLARFGALVNFISHSVVVGFTAGAGVLIATSQIKHFFALDIAQGLHFAEVIWQALRQITQVDLATTAVGALTLAAALVSRRYIRRIPYMLIALLVSVPLAWIANGFTLDGSGPVALVGNVPASLPPLSSPDFSATTLQQLAPATLAVTLFALAEAVSIARSLAVRRGELIDGDQEFIGQGLSNIAGSFLSAYVSTGSFNRSAINYEAGARTPLAAIISGLVLIPVVLLAAPLLAYIPKAGMAAVLFVVASGIVHISECRQILRASRSDATVLVVTFVSTLTFELDFAILLGVMLSLVLYLHQASRPRVIVQVPDPRKAKRQFNAAAGLPECPQLKILRIDGALFFGAVNYVAERLRIIAKRNPEQKHLLILARPISFVDIAGAAMLTREHRRRKSDGGGVYFNQMQPSVKRMLERAEYLQEFGEDHFFVHKGDAIAGVFDRLDKSICKTCTKRIFNECKSI
ncbi:MAG: SulP family inorganic anion transporter [Gammaproteobacteria bacterium]|nr:SulP family inorganic anion transporter [Gammaproteobacteria bacterium]